MSSLHVLDRTTCWIQRDIKRHVTYKLTLQRFLMIKSQIRLLLFSSLKCNLSPLYSCEHSAHLPICDVPFFAFLFTQQGHCARLFNPVPVPDEQGLLWMAIRIRLKVVVALFAAHVAVEGEKLQLLVLLRFHLNFLTVIVVVVVGVRLVLHHIAVDVLNVMLREGVRLEGL